MNAETRKCKNCGQNFTVESEDYNFYKKIDVPPPTFCPDCRFQRRLVFRNNRVFYRRECAMCGKSMLSVYHKDRPYIIYCRECWLSDKWDPMSYGTDYDFSRPFFEQFLELQKKVPRSNLYQTNFIQSEYCNYGLDFKECYLLFGGNKNERVYFANQVFDSQDSQNFAFSDHIEFSYGLFECEKSNKLFFSHHSKDCIESSYLVDCRNCINCFGCVGLVNKQYYIFNKPHTKEEYLEFVKSNNSGSHKSHLENLKKLEELEMSVPHRFARVYNSVNTDGDDLFDARNTHDSYSSRESEDSRFLFFCRHGSKDAHDTSFKGFNTELVYEACHGFGGHNEKFGIRNYDSRNAQYSEDCHHCQDIFGCEGLRKKSYCILNKQYTREEYEKLLPKIIDSMKAAGEYGEFFPAALSPFAYNETIAQEYFPLSKEEILGRGYEWQEIEERNYKTDFKTEDIPDHIKDVSEDILSKVIACAHGGICKEQCTEAFKVVSEELKFLKRMNLPLPRLCPNCRNYQLLKLRNPMKLWDRACMKCQTGVKSTYAPESPYIIYCEKCYQQEIY